MNNSLDFLKLIVYLFDSEKFETLEDIDWNRYCFTCLKYKSPGTKHCKEKGFCVEKFNHYS